jgi:hypothetical protein
MKLSVVLTKLSEKNEAQFQKAVKKIDRALDGYDRERPIEVPLDSKINRSVINRLIDRYSDPEMGWEVKPLGNHPRFKTLEFREPDFHYPHYPESTKVRSSRGRDGEFDC